MSRYSVASGPGAITDDGCAVDLYRRLEPGDDLEIVASVVAPNGRVLDLGAGAGRLACALADLGYRVTAVDQSPEMLAVIQGAERVQASIESLELGELKFDGVLLASYLLNTPDPVQRAAFLRTCRRYVDQSGAVLIQVRGRRILDDLSGFERQEGAIRDVVEHYSREGSLISMTWRTEVSGSVWTQVFTQEYLDEDQVRRALLDQGLVFERWLDRRREWLLARPARADPA